MTEPAPLRQTDRVYVLSGGRKLSYFSGCDYYRLASDPRTVAAARRAAEDEGLTVSASRLTTGNHRLFIELEKRLRGFFEAENALLVTAGYFGNPVVAQALAGEIELALIDERSHPALGDAARFLDCPAVTFKHRDPVSLRQALKEAGKKRVLLLTDGMFSHNGTVAPLADYLKLLPGTGRILVDDAHGVGVVGATGRGSLEAAGAGRARIIQTGTLSKAFGAGGGFILGSRELRAKIIARSRMFMGSTPVPLPLAAAAEKAVGILAAGGRRLKRLRANAAAVRASIAGTPWETESGPGPIMPILPRTEQEARDLRQRLLSAGVYPPFIKYPGGPKTGYFRFVISSEHRLEQIDGLASAIRKFAENFG